MFPWIAAVVVFLAAFVLLAAIHSRRERRRSSAEMRDHIRRNFRIGEKPWD